MNFNQLLRVVGMLSIILLLPSCSNRKPGSVIVQKGATVGTQGSGSNSNSNYVGNTGGTTSTTGSGTSTQCNSISATIKQISPTSNQFPAGTKVIWEVKAQGCAGFRLVRSDGSANLEFSSLAYFEKVYNQNATNKKEIIKIVAIENGVAGKEISVESAAFTVGPVGSNPQMSLACQVMSPAPIIDVPVTKDYIPKADPPTFEFQVNSYAQAQVVNVIDYGGYQTLQTALPAPLRSPIKTTLRSFGIQVISFIIADVANPNIKGECAMVVEVRPKVEENIPPSCTLTASAASILPGQSITLTLKVTGSAVYADIGGTMVSPLGGQTTITPTASGSARALVLNSAGIPATCDAPYTVAAPRLSCQIYYVTGVNTGCPANNPRYAAIFLSSTPTNLVNGQDPTQAVIAQAQFRYSPCGKLPNGYTSTNTLMNQPLPASVSYMGNTYQLSTGGIPGTAECSAYTRNQSPLVVDFSGTGVSLVAPFLGPIFDLTGDGIKQKYSWLNNPSTSLFLAYDKNRNGQIEGISELFGNATMGPDGLSAPNGFDALKKYDSNRDGRITSADAIWSQLSLWADFNRNGVSENGELYSLQDKNVKAIDLNYTNSRQRISFYGDEIGERSVIYLNDGRILPVYDLWLIGGGF